MRFWFQENMYGHYREVKPSGRCGRFDFSCRAEGILPGFVFDRLTRIQGQVTMEGVAEAAALEGTLRIDPLISRELVYDFTFQAGGARYRFLGKKTVRFLDPVASMTTLVGRVERDGIAFADVDSRFNLVELPAFLGSWRVGF